MKVFFYLIILILPSFIYCQVVKNPTDTIFVNTKSAAENHLKPSLYSSNSQSKILNLISGFNINSNFSSGTSGEVEGVMPLGSNKADQFNFSLQQILIKGSTQASPLTLDGITPNSTLKIGFQHMFWNPTKTTTNDKNFYNKVGIDFLKRNKRPESDITSLMFSELDSIALKKLKKHLSEPWFFNVSFSISPNSFEYATDSTSLKTIKANKINASIDASVIKVIKNNSAIQEILSFNFAYVDKYKAGDSITLLTPFGTTNNYEQKNVSFGVPADKTDEQLSLEYRLGLLKGSSFYFGFSPALSYSIQMKNLLLQIPVYLLNGKDSKGNPQGLNGGINLGYQLLTSGNWVSFNNGFGLSLFVGVPFTVFSSD
jgi:hypothetical protein